MMFRTQQNYTVSNVSTCSPLLQGGSNAVFSIYTFFLLINFVVGLPANMWVVWIIYHGSTEMLASDIHHLSQAVCEILNCSWLPAELYCMYVIENSVMGMLRPLESFKMLLRLPISLVWTARPLFQCFICLERFLAVVYPLIFIRLKPLKYRVAQCALSWSLYIVISIPRLLEDDFKKEDYSGLIWFIPTLCFFLFCQFSVLYSLKRPRPGDRQREEKTSGDKMKIKAFYIILMHLLCFLINYVPTLSVAYIRLTHRKLSYSITLSLGLICGLVQPLHFLHRVGKISRLWRVLITRLNRQK